MVKAKQKPKIPISEDPIELKPFTSNDSISPNMEDIGLKEEQSTPEKMFLQKKAKGDVVIKNKGYEPTKKDVASENPHNNIVDSGEKVDMKYIKYSESQGRVYIF